MFSDKLKLLLYVVFITNDLGLLAIVKLVLIAKKDIASKLSVMFFSFSYLLFLVLNIKLIPPSIYGDPSETSVCKPMFGIIKYL